MNRYVVALYSNFDGSMLMDEVFAETDVQAGKLFLESQGDNSVEDMEDVKTYDELQQFVFNQDHAIGVYKVSGNKQKSETPVAALLRH